MKEAKKHSTAYIMLAGYSLITIDVESSKEVRDGKMHHRYYKEDIEKPCKRIIRISTVQLMGLMSANHDLQVHIHRLTPLLSEGELTGILRNEVDLMEEFTGMLEMFWHLNRIIFKGEDISWIYVRWFEWILKFLAERDVGFVKMSEVGEGIERGEIFVED